MESHRSNGRIRERLARIFRLSCKPSTSAATPISGNTSSRTLLSYIAHDPVFIPHRHDDEDYPSRHQHRNFAKSIKGKDCSKSEKKQRRVRENGRLYETGKAEGRTCPPVSPSSPSKNSYYYYYCFNGIDQVVDKRQAIKNDKKKKKKKKKTTKLLTNSYGFTTSSSMESNEEDNGYGFFSSEGERKAEETETFFSSRSFSSDSSEFYQRPLPSSKKNKKRSSDKEEKEKEKEKEKKRNSSRRASSCNKCDIRDGFLPLVSVTSSEKKAKNGFAVVKRSKDPYADFRQSMVEMIVERQIYGGEDLERLLHSYLSLNSTRHHPVILQAFSDIWVVLFGH